MFETFLLVRPCWWMEESYFDHTKFFLCLVLGFFKAQIFWEGHKNLKMYIPLYFDVSEQFNKRSYFIAFSKDLNLNTMAILQKLYFKGLLKYDSLLLCFCFKQDKIDFRANLFLHCFKLTVTFITCMCYFMNMILTSKLTSK